MQKTRKEDSQLREQVIELLRDGFVLVARRRVGDENAEDIAHDACVTVLQKYESGARAQHFEAWAYQILRNKIGNYLQKNRVRRNARGTPDMTVANGSTSSDPELKRKIERCLLKMTKMNPRYAQVLTLACQGFTTAEICERCDVSLPNLYVLMNRSRSALRKCLEEGTN